MLSEKQNNFVIETRNLTKKFGAFEALSNVSLKIKSGSIHAILGENGAGKTTLLKHLFGLLRPNRGEILYNGSVVNWKSPLEAITNGIGMVQQHFTLVEELSALDNIILGAEPCHFGKIDRAQALADIEKLLPSSFLSVPWNALVQDLSVGQKQKIEILKLLYRNSTVLILDEPTAVLAPHEIEDFFLLLRKLKAQGCTIIIITHKLHEVFSLCDEISVLRNGRGLGTFRITEIQYDQVVELMIGRKPVRLTSDRKPSLASVTLECKDLRQVKAQRGGLKNVSLLIKTGEIVGIAGVEGSGQSNFVEVLLGLQRFEGTLKFFNQTLSDISSGELRQKIGLIPEDRLHQGLWSQESSYHNLIIGLEFQFAKMGWMSETQIKKITPQWANELDVRASSLDVAVGSLSGGNQQKIILARETRGKDAQFLICHHPTRGVDLGAIELIHKEFLRLRNENHSLLVLSSDLDELFALCDRIYVMFDGQIVHEISRSKFDALEIGRYMTGATV